MKTRNGIVIACAALIVLLGSTGLWLSGWFTGADDMTGMRLSNAATYQAGPYRVAVAINPEAPEVGDNQFMVMLSNTDGEPVTDASIKAFGEMAAMGAMPAMRAPADLDEIEPGVYLSLIHI